MQGDSVKPGTQTGVAMEAANAAEDFNKYFLGDVSGVVSIVDAAGNQRIERLMILCDRLRSAMNGSPIACSVTPGSARLSWPWSH